MEGWIKLHRKFLEWEWFSKPEMVQLFIYFLLKANYEPKQFQGISLGIGQLLTTNPQIQKDTGLTEQQVRTCVKRLISTDEITYKSTGKKVLITICKYDSYQLLENKANGISNAITNGLLTDKQRIANGLSTDIQRNKEVNNNILLTCAHESRFLDQEISECFKRLKEDQQWIEFIMLSCFRRGHKDLTEEKVIGYLEMFLLDLQARGEDKKTLADAKSHFANWIKIELEKQQKHNGTNKQTTRSSQNGTQSEQIRVRTINL
nr:MAG TPA: replisome organizer [Caudoviricetes sp.]